MDTKTIIAVGLMVLVYFVFFSPSPTPPPPAPQEEVSSTLSPAESISARPQGTEFRQPDFVSERFRLSNEIFEVETDATGRLFASKLLNYNESPESEEIVGWDFSETDGFNKQSIFISGKPVRWESTSFEDGIIRLKSEMDGLSLERQVSLRPDSYVLSVIDRIENTGRLTHEVATSIELRKHFDLEEQPSFWLRILKPQTDFMQAVWLSEGNLEKEMLHSLTGEMKIDSLLSWSGFSSKYFFFGAIAPGVQSFQVSRENSLSQTAEENLQLAVRQVPPQESREIEVLYYVGPKEISELKKVDAQLDLVIDYGNWIGPISRLLLSILRFFHDIVPNYGLAIILLTLLVKLVLFPLSYKSAVSMKKLQLVQPRMKEIRDKYKSNPQRMQAEMMSLYRTEKVNPVGGCLPILLQMPIFFALYRVFFTSIEMRHEPFVFWINDLAHYDPFFVTPVLMAVLMYFQQKLTPMPGAGGEETEAIRIQKAMFKWMPIIFGGIMLFLPAGLTLYFLTNALLSILQQLYLNKKLAHLVPNNSTGLKAANGNS